MLPSTSSPFGHTPECTYGLAGLLNPLRLRKLIRFSWIGRERGVRDGECRMAELHIYNGIPEFASDSISILFTKDVHHVGKGED